MKASAGGRSPGLQHAPKSNAILRAELGAGPLAIARAQRAQTARLLIETSSLPMAETALAAGFASIRSFNDTVREVFASSPTELRRRVVEGAQPATPGTLTLRLAFRRPLCPDNLFGQLAATAVQESRNGGMAGTAEPSVCLMVAASSLFDASPITSTAA